MPTRVRAAGVKTARLPKTTRDIFRVKVTHNQDEANELLADGWVLLHGGVSHLDTAGFNVKPVFVLGAP